MNHTYTLPQQIGDSFLGTSPDWYKLTIVGFLVLNPILLFVAGPFVTGWVILLQFIFTLAMALMCYPLQPGGLLAFEAVVIGMTSPGAVAHEIEANFEVILLLIFMVAGVFFLKDLLLFIFTKILVRVRSKTLLAVMMCSAAALLSAFLDALTVTAVVIGVMGGFYTVYQKVSEGTAERSHHREDLARFRAFLRSLVMHAVVGTALGGVMTVVGEPQNLLIATIAGWEFQEFFMRMAPVSLPVFVVGLATCALLERFGWFGYGAPIPETVRAALIDFDRAQSEGQSPRAAGHLFLQSLVLIFLVVSLAFQLAAVGIIGLAVIVLATAFTGITDERRLGRAFEEALPFTALLAVFFVIVSVIHEQHLFQSITGWVLEFSRESQPAVLFLVNGALSMISDNVFVATVYMSELSSALNAGTIDRVQFDRLVIAINTGTNLPSIATPNGQAAFLFLLTSSLAPLINLSYFRMIHMALPYTLSVTITGLAAIITQI